MARNRIPKTVEITAIPTEDFKLEDALMYFEIKSCDTYQDTSIIKLVTDTNRLTYDETMEFLLENFEFAD